MKDKCDCAQPDAPGWHIADVVRIKHGSLRQAQNEAAEEVAGWIANIYFTKSEKIFNDLMLSIADEEFKGSYGRLCDWQNVSIAI
jgi:hypothetical protein